ncbi:hypothetical protein C8Q80DRAFT_358704 [Daedaleopsis nitida]|nr:hypothetical protein C8Q80DRAFT_358704 [Daedaleopsis nitida]
MLMQHVHEGTGDRHTHDPIARLKELGLVPHGYSHDDWTNLMTLCRAHADAYDMGAWRWLPNAPLRAQLASAPLPSASTSRTHPEADAEGDVPMDEEPHAQHSMSLATEDGLDPPHAETLVDDGISEDTKNPEIHFEPVELPAFDVLVLRPESMPPSSPDAPTTRVWREWRTLTLNPHVVLAAALSLVEAGALDGAGDEELRRVQTECLAVRDHWRDGTSARDEGEGMEE